MKAFAALAGVLCATAVGGATADEWAAAPVVEVRLSSYSFAPATLRLRASEPVRLKLVNASQMQHAFAAPAFFGAGQVRDRDRKLLQGGRVLVPAGSVREITVLPAAGRFSLKCSNRVHKMIGMSGQIIVE